MSMNLGQNFCLEKSFIISCCQESHQTNINSYLVIKEVQEITLSNVCADIL